MTSISRIDKKKGQGLQSPRPQKLLKNNSGTLVAVEENMLDNQEQEPPINANILMITEKKKECRIIGKRRYR